ncbi:MAG: hypothetical protein JNK65_08155, partial [Deltaproteobacteria bacterium]|nr:hypothetical protein [Deltaproteobacteria bacterium]
MKKHIQILLLLLVFLCGACSSSGPGSQNPITPTPPVPVFGNFVLGVAASQNGVVLSQLRNQVVLAHPQVHSLVSVENNGIQIRETRNVVSDISFEGDNELVPQIEFPETYVVRLIQNGSIVNQEFPSFGVKNIAFDTYRKFEMKFEKINQGLIPPSILPDPITEQFLLDHSVVIEGSFLESHDLNNDGQ